MRENVYQNERNERGDIRDDGARAAAAGSKMRDGDRDTYAPGLPVGAAALPFFPIRYLWM